MYLYRLHRLMALVTGVGLGVIFVVTGVHGRYNRAMGTLSGLSVFPPSFPPSLPPWCSCCYLSLVCTG